MRARCTFCVEKPLSWKNSTVKKFYNREKNSNAKRDRWTLKFCCTLPSPYTASPMNISSMKIGSYLYYFSNLGTIVSIRRTPCFRRDTEIRAPRARPLRRTPNRLVRYRSIAAVLMYSRDRCQHTLGIRSTHCVRSGERAGRVGDPPLPSIYARTKREENTRARKNSPYKRRHLLKQPVQEKI